MKSIHISELDDNFQIKNDFEIPNLMLMQMISVEDGILSLLVGEIRNNTFVSTYPNILYFMKVDYKGKILVKTTLTGDKGQGAQTVWYDYGGVATELDYNGSEYAAFYPVKKNFAKSSNKKDIHQGDEFLILTKDGKIKPKTRITWGASHSTGQRLTHDNSGNFYTITASDANPYGIQYKQQPSIFEKTIFPENAKNFPRDGRYAKGCGHTQCAGLAGGFIYKNDTFYLSLGAVEDMPIKIEQKVVYPLFLSFSKDGKIIDKKWVTKKVKCRYVDMVPWNDGFMYGCHYYKNEKDSENLWRSLALIKVDKKGNLIGDVELLNSGIEFKMHNYGKNGLLWYDLKPYRSDITFYTLVE